jgi:hypothetical protein
LAEPTTRGPGTCTGAPKRLRELFPEADSPDLDDPQVAQQVEIQVKYQGYIDRQRLEVDRAAGQESLAIPLDFDFSSVKSLSHEVLQKLQSVRPHTIGQASRISGMTPAAISLLLVSLKRQRKAGTRDVEVSLGTEGTRAARGAVPPAATVALATVPEAVAVSPPSAVPSTTCTPDSRSESATRNDSVPTA